MSRAMKNRCMGPLLSRLRNLALLFGAKCLRLFAGLEVPDDFAASGATSAGPSVRVTSRLKRHNGTVGEPSALVPAGRGGKAAARAVFHLHLGLPGELVAPGHQVAHE